MNQLLLQGYSGILVVWVTPRRRSARSKTWSERLGWPADKKVVIFHADDIGMLRKAKMREQAALSAAAGAMSWFNDMAAWCVDQARRRLALTLTSEWKYYRWG